MAMIGPGFARRGGGRVIVLPGEWNVSMARAGWSVQVAAALTAGAIAVGAAGCSNPPPRYANKNDLVPAKPTAANAAEVAVTQPVHVSWLSGASGERAANGTYGRWRRAAVTIGGTWDNGNEEQVQLTSICPGGAWARWRKPLDIAVGAIDQTRGETWAAAAKGAYDRRWKLSFLKMKTCWGRRDPGNLYIRFAHEMNLGVMPWHVAGGQEANFVKAITRYSNLRYKILPKAKIVLCPSDGTDVDLGVHVRSLWPGKDRAGRLVANIYAVDTYNGYIVVHNQREFDDKLHTTGKGDNPLGLETHRQIAEDMGVPFAVSEWSNNGDPKDPGKGSEQPDYVLRMNAWFRDHAGNPKKPQAGKLLYEIQFNLKPRFAFLPTKLQPKTAAAYRALTWGH